MGKSYLFIGMSAKDAEEKLGEIVQKEFGRKISDEKMRTLPDVKFVEPLGEKKTIGIQETREAIKFLSEKPFSEKIKLLVIFKAEKLTTEAQNSLLKTLEEPPSYAVIVLSAKKPSDLLDTVISRCKKIQSKPLLSGNVKSKNTPKKEFPFKERLQEVLKMPKGDRLDWAGEVSKEERADIIDLLDEFIGQGRGVLLKNPHDLDMAENLQYINSIKSDLENTNINPRLGLEYLVLKLK